MDPLQVKPNSVLVIKQSKWNPEKNALKYLLNELTKRNVFLLIVPDGASYESLSTQRIHQMMHSFQNILRCRGKPWKES